MAPAMSRNAFRAAYGGQIPQSRLVGRSGPPRIPNRRGPGITALQCALARAAASPAQEHEDRADGDDDREGTERGIDAGERGSEPPDVEALRLRSARSARR